MSIKVRGKRPVSQVNAGTISLDTLSIEVLGGQSTTFFSSRSNGSNKPVAVDWSITGVTSSPSSGTFTWADGETGQRSASTTPAVVGAITTGQLVLSNARFTDGTAGAPAVGIGSTAFSVAASEEELPFEYPPYEFPAGSTPTASAAALTAVPTFENISLYWKESTGSHTNTALVRFRRQGDPTWREALPLWFDDRPASFTNSTLSKQYRGSILKVSPNTTYDVEVLTQGTRRLASTSVTTWSETFPVKEIVTVSSSSSALVITTGGSEADGYVVYQPAAATQATINVNKNAAQCVDVNANWVIVRGLTLRGAQKNGVTIRNGRHHIVVEQCDIADWGTEDSRMPGSGFGLNDDRGIGNSGGSDSNLEHIVVQDNTIHDPTYDSNSWEERREGGTNHPWGPHAIFFTRPLGRIVLRYNTIYSTIDHMFNDAIGGSSNSGQVGNLGSDSDVYGNLVNHCWDDGIEIEGGNRNVRCYENSVFRCYQSIATAQVTQGPLYVFGNISRDGVYTHTSILSDGLTNRGNTWKHRAAPNITGTMVGTTNGGGRLYWVGNLTYGQNSTDYVSRFASIASNAWANVVMHNNIVQASTTMISDRRPNAVTEDPANGLYLPICSHNWFINDSGMSAAQSNPITGSTLTFDPTNDSGEFTLASNSPGLNAAKLLPTINDAFYGTGPDAGPQERGAPPLHFGVREVWS